MNFVMSVANKPIMVGMKNNPLFGGNLTELLNFMAIIIFRKPGDTA